MGKYAGKKRAGRILTVMVCVLGALLFVRTGKAETDWSQYNFMQYEYEGWCDNVSEFRYKDTSSSMAVSCMATTASFRVHALGADLWGVPKSYADCSGGYYYWLSAGDCQFNVINFVYERGYTCAGIQGEYAGDAYFKATGNFVADQ